MFLVFFAKTFIKKLCKNVFKKISLILFWPKVVFDKIKEYSGV
jgi:hypothetical protein